MQFNLAPFIASIICFTSILCAPLAAQEQKDDSSIFATDTRARLPEGAVTLLIAGADEFPITTKRASVPLTRGVAIILTDPYQGLFGEHGLVVINAQLNAWGWRTITVPAPMLHFSSSAEVPSQTNATTATNNISQEALTRYLMNLSRRIDAVLNHVQSIPGYRLMISQGISGAGMTRLYAQGNLPEPDGLVLVAPFWPQLDLNQQLADEIAQSAIPTLDLTSPWANRWSAMTQAQRQVAAKVDLKLHYRQRDIIGTDLNHLQYEAIGKEIYGWITHLGW